MTIRNGHVASPVLLLLLALAVASCGGDAVDRVPDTTTSADVTTAADDPAVTASPAPDVETDATTAAEQPTAVAATEDMQDYHTDLLTNDSLYFATTDDLIRLASVCAQSSYDPDGPTGYLLRTPDGRTLQVVLDGIDDASRPRVVAARLDTEGQEPATLAGAGFARTGDDGWSIGQGRLTTGDGPEASFAFRIQTSDATTPC